LSLRIKTDLILKDLIILNELREDLPELEDDNKSWDKKVNTLYEMKIGCGEPGLFKSETKWASLTEFVALRPKQYSLIDENGKTSMKSKGINKKAVKKYLTHQQMVDQVLKDVDEVGCKMDHFVSKKCDMHLEYVWKRAFINYEDKRYWLDSIYSLPYGHPWIEDIVSGKVSINDIVKRIKGNDEKEIEQKGNDILFRLSDVEVVKQKCKISVPAEEINTVKDNTNAMRLLDKFNEDQFEEEF